MYLKVRQACLNDGESQRQAAASFGVNRRTVAKMINNPEPSGYRRTKECTSKIDAHKEFIDQIFEIDKSAPPKQQHTAKRILERLIKEKNFSGGYTIIKEYVAKAKEKHKEMFLPLLHPAGDAQADFGEAYAIIGGVKIKVHIFVIDLPHSDACFVKAYQRENTEAFCDGHVSAFEFFGGVPRRIVYDNSTIAVSRVLKYRERKTTHGFTTLQSYYLFKDSFARVNKGNDKGKVENLVGFMRRKFMVPVPNVESIDALNAHLLAGCLERQKDILVKHKSSIGERLESEKTALLGLPAVRYEACRLASATVSSQSLVRFETNDYSVPVQYGYKQVYVKGYVNDVIIVLQDKIIARHKRSYLKHSVVFDPMHYLSLLEQKANALDQAAPLQQWSLPNCFEKLKGILAHKDEQSHNNNGKREYIKVLRLLETFSLDEVTQGIIEAERIGVFSYEAIKHLILKQVEHKPSTLSLSDLERIQPVRVNKTSASDYNQLIGEPA
jgi:transposase